MIEHKGGVARWAPGRGLSFLLYSPAHDGGHIKWPPVRAELAINFISARPTGNLPIRDRFVLVGFICGNAEAMIQLPRCRHSAGLARACDRCR